MPDLWNRTLQTRAPGDKKGGGVAWNFSAHPAPDAVVVSLGGNDFNHQGGHVPSNTSFDQHYEHFIGRIFGAYDHDHAEHASSGGSSAAAGGTHVVALCGMGDPEEAKTDPDNNRCRPCPHVEAAVAAFAAANPTLKQRLHYIFVPCDGSVVTGDGDIGCNGHKNRAGQLEVARFVAPKLGEILGWNSDV